MEAQPCVGEVHSSLYVEKRHVAANIWMKTLKFNSKTISFIKKKTKKPPKIWKFWFFMLFPSLPWLVWNHLHLHLTFLVGFFSTTINTYTDKISGIMVNKYKFFILQEHKYSLGKKISFIFWKHTGIPTKSNLQWNFLRLCDVVLNIYIFQCLYLW